ncbi:GTP-binding protein, partial [Candidatus Kapabacteria bacterium]|nr:GTP-binding protein [Candidatus Kapabacteria bacterium]
MDLLRFSTAGSVDDGKSTLIGRLLYESKSIYEDQLEALELASKKKGDGLVNLALLTDGLRAEREQGITIDVAYRYFNTPKRKFIIADTPGHIQYTRNMVTGASNSNLALILIDARNGMTEQSRRHTFISSLLGIPHLIFCINKMDLVDFDENQFDKIKNEIDDFCTKLSIKDIRFIPMSALHGDNVVNKSKKMEWYSGETLLNTLENLHISSDRNLIDCRFPVQYVIRPETTEYHDHRAYSGKIASGIFKVGDKIIALPSGFSSKIKKIYNSDTSIEMAFPPMSISITLEDDIDISRGDMLVRENNSPNISQDIELMVCWLSNKKMQENGKYTILHTSSEVRCIIKEIKYKLDINSLHRLESDKVIGMNDIARIAIRTTKPLFTDEYSKNRITG